VNEGAPGSEGCKNDIVEKGDGGKASVGALGNGRFVHSLQLWVRHKRAQSCGLISSELPTEKKGDQFPPVHFPRYFGRGRGCVLRQKLRDWSIPAGIRLQKADNWVGAGKDRCSPTSLEVDSRLVGVIGGFKSGSPWVGTLRR